MGGGGPASGRPGRPTAGTVTTWVSFPPVRAAGRTPAAERRAEAGLLRNPDSPDARKTLRVSSRGPSRRRQPRAGREGRREQRAQAQSRRRGTGRWLRLLSGWEGATRRAGDGVRPGEPEGLGGRPRQPRNRQPPGEAASARGAAAGGQVRRGPGRARSSGSLFPGRRSPRPGRQPAEAESRRTAGCVAAPPPPPEERVPFLKPACLM